MIPIRTQCTQHFDNSDIFDKHQWTKMPWSFPSYLILLGSLYSHLEAKKNYDGSSLGQM